MQIFSAEEIDEALSVISSVILNCENMILKFKSKTAQHTLLLNRIKALIISKSLIEKQKVNYTKNELIEALNAVSSIINKSEKALSKQYEGAIAYLRLDKLIKAMKTAKVYIETKLI